MAENKSLLRKLDTGSGTSLYLAIAVVLLAFVVGGFIAYRNTRTLSEDATLVTHTHEVLTSLDDILSLAKDAETGQRGFVITGNGRYLEPYNSATKQIGRRLDEIEKLVSDNPEQLSQLPSLRALVQGKLEVLTEAVELRRKSGFEAAQAVIISDRGRDVMDQIRARIESMEQIERGLRAQRVEEMTRAYHVAIVSGLVTTLIGMSLAALVRYLLRQAMLRRAEQDWLQTGQIQLAQAMSGDQSHDQLGQNVLRFFAEYLEA